MNRSNNFDALRILAAAAVIYGHAHPLTATPDLVFLGNATQSLAVKVFFVISGFLVAGSWESDADPMRYLAKRALRIFPGLLLCLLFTVLVLGPITTTLAVSDYLRDPSTWRYVGYNAALSPAYGLPGVFTGNLYPNAVNGSLWSLPVEFLMYLVFPLAYGAAQLARSRWWLAAFTAGFCLTSLYFVRVAPPAIPTVFYGTGLPSVLDVGPYFFLGALFWTTPLRATLNPSAALFLVGACVLLQPAGAVAPEAALYLVAPYAILSCATASAPVLSRAGRFGDPSYGIYLYGFPMQQLVVYLIPNVTPIGNTLGALPLAVAAGYLSWHLLEKRALSLKPRRANRGIPPSTSTAQTGQAP